MSPSVRNIAPRVAVNYSPENGSQAVSRAFADWTEVSQWATGLYDPQVIVDDNVAAKARELTANAKTELEKIQAIVNQSNSVYLTEKTRAHPVLLDAESFNETATFTLSTGFVIDEMPDAVSLKTPFGNYPTNYAAKDGKLVFTRKLVMNRTTVPVEKYNSVKDFYSKILAAEQSPVVLLKK